jgi:hypothetical protein
MNPINDQERRRDAYRGLLLDPRWRTRRQEILERKGRRCEDCGSQGPLEVHHGYYRAGRAPWDYPDSAFHVLCTECHGDEHRGGPLTPTAPLVRSLAAQLAMPRVERDPRARLWEIARSRASSKAQASELMAVISWLWFKRGIHDLVIVNAVASKIGGMTNPYAFLQPGGRALESLIGARAVERAQDEQHQHQAEDETAGLGRRRR